MWGVVQHAGKMLLSALNRMKERRTTIHRIHRLIFPLHQQFVLKLSTLCQANPRTQLYFKWKSAAVLEWSEVWRGRFYTIGVTTLLALNCAKSGVTFESLSSRTRMAESDFSLRSRMNEALRLNCCWSFVWENLRCRQYMITKYEECIIEGVRKTFRKWTSREHEELANRENMEHDVWIALASFCALPYINDGRNLLGDETPELERVQHVRNIDGEFYQTQSPDYTSDFQSLRVLGTFALHNLNIGE